MASHTTSPLVIFWSSTSKPSFKKSKKSFLLLEILIAIFLLSICLAPLLQAPLLAYKTEIQTLQSIQINALATTSFAEIKLLLLNQEIPFEKLPLPGQTSSEFNLSTCNLEIPGIKTMSIQRSFTLSCPKAGQELSDTEDLYRILVVEIFFLPKDKSNERFFFKTIIKKSSTKEHVI